MPTALHTAAHSQQKFLHPLHQCCPQIQRIRLLNFANIACLLVADKTTTKEAKTVAKQLNHSPSHYYQTDCQLCSCSQPNMILACEEKSNEPACISCLLLTSTVHTPQLSHVYKLQKTATQMPGTTHSVAHNITETQRVGKY